MGLSDLPMFVIQVNIGCCNACPSKLYKLLSKAEGVAVFDIDTEQGLVEIKGNADPQYLVQTIAKALNKKKTKLVHYELPKKKVEEKNANETKPPSEEIKHDGQDEHHSHDEEETHSAAHGEHPIVNDMHHHPNGNLNHYSHPPPNPHYPPPRGPVDRPHYEYNSPEMHHHQPVQHFEPNPNYAMPAPPSAYPYYPGYAGPATVSGPPLPPPPPATDNACNYFSDENANGCAIM